MTHESVQPAGTDAWLLEVLPNAAMLLGMATVFAALPVVRLRRQLSGA